MRCVFDCVLLSGVGVVLNTLAPDGFFVMVSANSEEGFVDPRERACRKSLGECDLD